MDPVPSRGEPLDLDADVQPTRLVLHEASPPDRVTRGVDDARRGVGRAGSGDGADREPEQDHSDRWTEQTPDGKLIHLIDS
jgi:hypothetical protein